MRWVVLDRLSNISADVRASTTQSGVTCLEFAVHFEHAGTTMNQTENDSPHVGNHWSSGSPSKTPRRDCGKASHPHVQDRQRRAAAELQDHQAFHGYSNSRTVNEHLTLDRQEFALVQHPIAIANFYYEA
jgi:hypothetical protein